MKGGEQKGEDQGEEKREASSKEGCASGEERCFTCRALAHSRSFGLERSSLTGTSIRALSTVTWEG